MKDGFVSDFKRFFFRGLAAMLPTVVTLMIFVYIFAFIYKYLGRYINVGVQWLVVQSVCLFRRMDLTLGGDEEIWEQTLAIWGDYYLSLIGFILAFVAIYVFGRFVASYIGRGIWRGIEKAFFRLPVVKQVYPHVKQVTDFLFVERKVEFSHVVAVEYPRKGIWSMGLVTGVGLRTVHDVVRQEMLTIFIPSSPTPVTGYTIMVRREDAIDLPISIDEALRFTVSGGVIPPPGQELNEAVIEEARKSPIALPEKKEKPA